MQVVVDPAFPYPTQFLISSRAAGVSAPPVEVIGVLIVKQTVQTDGTIAAQEAILLTDELYEDNTDPTDPTSPHFGHTHLTIHLESDLEAYKPNLDLIVVRASFEAGTFGNIRIDRGGGFSLPLSLDYGWQSRVGDARRALAGDAAGFVPDIGDKFKLPTGFQNTFFNGGRLTGIAHLEAGHVVEYDDSSVAIPPVQVTIPPGPNLTITVNGAAINPPVQIDLNVDTVVYDASADHFLITWRATFPWADRLAGATLEVN